MRKVVLITGSTRGIGRAIALKYAQMDYDIIINGLHSVDALHALKDEITVTYQVNCLAYVTDVANYQKVEEMFKDIYSHYESIDVVINNAGTAHIGLFTDLTEDEWDSIMNINLKSIYNVCKQAIPAMVRQQRGNIINISSMWGITGASCEVAYSASKGAVNSLTKALAKELAPSHIRVNAIAPGVIKTDMNKWLDDTEMRALKEEIPMGRFGHPEEVADCCYYLSSKDSSYLTGQIITLDGGMI
ncbi:elongation factor P 5-aminopentanone reductase [Vallitalea okinawensis]|uniref:elongation factor P 5-aminopentanone reductase n=1 Tax=Vallitalea okinawensis TaxID=2078660 RepID=UPI000CFC6B76|nr:SDR family oxidoreductase [Vallitalea okinawensis]